MNKLQRRFIHLLLCAVLIALFSGCAISGKKNSPELESLFANGITSATNTVTYNIDRTAQDYARLAALTRELKSINEETAKLTRELCRNDKTYFTQKENNKVAFLIFRFRSASIAISELSDFYFNSKGETEDAQARGMVLALNAAFNWSYHRARIVALIMKQNRVVALGNAAYPHYEIPAGTYKDLFLAVTSVDELKRISISWELFANELTKKDSALVCLQKADAKYAALIEDLDVVHADAVIHIYYVLHESSHSLMNVHNYLRHTSMASMSRSVSKAFHQDMYAAQGSLFKNVARIKRPATRLTVFSETDLHKIKSMLRPGDIILTFTAGYMSNVFLPGNFKHGITYVGTPAQRRAAGLTDEQLAQSAISPAQLKSLRENVARDKTNSGLHADCIEAVAEGVVFSSLEEIMETHVNRMLILRPAISEKERTDQLVSLFGYIGTPYDFNFDFSENSYQCCTELIYRTLNGKGNVKLDFAKVRGKWVLTADNIANYSLNSKSTALKPILFVNSSKKDPKARLYEGNTGKKELQQLMTAQTAK